MTQDLTRSMPKQRMECRCRAYWPEKGYRWEEASGQEQNPEVGTRDNVAGNGGDCEGPSVPRGDDKYINQTVKTKDAK